jgi:MFS family permease
VTLHAFDEMAVATALPVIVGDLGGRALYGAAFFAYLLASLVGLVLGGGEASRRGPAAPFVAGLVVFAGGLVAGTLASDMEAVIVGRALQGLGGGIVTATVYVVIQRGFDEGERPRVLALQASAWVIPALVAPAAAGALIDAFSWRAVFAALLPLALLAGVLGVPSMRAIRAVPSESHVGRELVDGLRLALGLGLALWVLARPFGLFEGLAVAGGAFAARAPLARALPAGLLWARPGLPAAMLLKILLVFAFFGTEAFVPLALIELRGLSPLQAGLALTGAALCWTSGSHLQARFVERVGVRAMALVGAIGLCLALFAVRATLEPSAPLAAAVVAWALAGFGMGVGYVTATASAMAHTPPGGEGTTSTALGVGDAVSISLATGLGGAVLAASARADLPLEQALSWIWTALAWVSVVTVAAAWRVGDGGAVPEGDATALALD